MPAVHGLMTADELLALPRDGRRRELIRGELRVMSPSSLRHVHVAANLIILLGGYVKRHGLGAVLSSEGGFVLARDPDTVRAPDAAFVRAERIPPAGLPSTFGDGPPDLAVEVPSPSDRRRDVEEKVAAWLAAGSAEAWVLDPQRRTAEIHRASGEVQLLDADDELTGGELIPGFACRLAEVWA